MRPGPRQALYIEGSQGPGQTRAEATLARGPVTGPIMSGRIPKEYKTVMAYVRMSFVNAIASSLLPFLHEQLV